MPGTSLDIVVDTHGLEKKLLAKGDQLQSKIKQMQQLMLTDAHREVQDKAPRQTGNLKDAIQWKMGTTSGQVFANTFKAKYAYWVIDGTRPHIITPKNKKALYWKGAEHPWALVHHPGTKPNPFFDKAVPQIERDIENRISAFEKWLDE